MRVDDAGATEDVVAAMSEAAGATRLAGAPPPTVLMPVHIEIEWDGSRDKWRGRAVFDGRVVELGFYTSHQQAVLVGDAYVRLQNVLDKTVASRA